MLSRRRLVGVSWPSRSRLVGVPEQNAKPASQPATVPVCLLGLCVQSGVTSPGAHLHEQQAAETAAKFSGVCVESGVTSPGAHLHEHQVAETAAKLSGVSFRFTPRCVLVAYCRARFVL